MAEAYRAYLAKNVIIFFHYFTELPTPQPLPSPLIQLALSFAQATLG